MVNAFEGQFYGIPSVPNVLDNANTVTDPDGSVGWSYGGFPVVKRTASTAPGNYRSQGIFRWTGSRPTSLTRKSYGGNWKSNTTTGTSEYIPVGDIPDTPGFGANTYRYVLIWGNAWSQGTYPGETFTGDTGPAGAWLTTGSLGLPSITTNFTWVVDISFEFEVQASVLAGAAMSYRFLLSMYDSANPTINQGSRTNTSYLYVSNGGKKIADEKGLRITRHASLAQGTRRTISMLGVLNNQVNLDTDPKNLAAQVWLSKQYGTDGVNSAPGYRIVDVRATMYAYPQLAALTS